MTKRVKAVERSTTTIPKVQPGSLPARQRRTMLGDLSTKWGVDEAKVIDIVKATAFRRDAKEATIEHVYAFLIVANMYDLNPFLREIHAFVSTEGGVVPIVGIDGWVKKVNGHPKFEGVEFAYHHEIRPASDKDPAKELLKTVDCTMHVLGLRVPITITEHFGECYRQTPAWQKWPRRMLRHKAYIQCARIAFGIMPGVYDEDEAARIIEAEGGPIIDITEIPDPRAIDALALRPTETEILPRSPAAREPARETKPGEVERQLPLGGGVK